MTVTANEAMLHIMALDSGASLQYSEFTGKWFVSSSIQIGDGATLTSPTEHRTEMSDAVLSYFDRLKAVDFNNHEHCLVTDASRERRHWRWNGATFVQIPLPVTVTSRDITLSNQIGIRSWNDR